MNPKKESRLLKFTKTCFHFARQAVPDYRSKFSKHTFTQPQHIALNASLYILKNFAGLL